MYLAVAGTVFETEDDLAAFWERNFVGLNEKPSKDGGRLGTVVSSIAEFRLSLSRV